jgi:hypothetical protein
VHAVEQGYPRTDIVKMLRVSLATIKRYLKNHRDSFNLIGDDLRAALDTSLAERQVLKRRLTFERCVVYLLCIGWSVS